MKYDDPLWQQVERDPEIVALKAKMRELEHRLREVVADEAWEIFLEWEALWAQYLTLTIERLLPLVISQLKNR
jgi:hypothetical protein